MRGEPIYVCARGHRSTWIYRNEACPMCALLTQVAEIEKENAKLRARLEEREKIIDLMRSGLIDRPLL